MSLYSRLKNSLPELGRLSSIPAGMIDRAYRDEPATGYFGKLRSFITIRAIYVFLFIPSLFIDMLVSLMASVRYFLGALFRSDHVQQERISQFQKYSTQFSRSLYALLGFVFGVFSPKLVAFYFTPEKPNAQGVTAGGHYHHDQHAKLVKPESIEELQIIIQNAAHSGQKVIPVGAGFSQGKQFLPEHGSAIVVDLSQLNTVEINTNDKTAVVGAGACWFKIQEKADEFKLALQVMQASNVFSVGGSIGTNIHGWDHQSGVLSNTIESIEIVNARGELQRLTPSDPLFNAIMGGFGLCGIVVRATIKLTDNLKLKEVGTFIPVKDYAQYFREQVIHDKTAKMHLFRLSLHPNHLLEEGVAVSYVAQDNTPVVTPNLITKELQQGTRFERVMVNLARRINWLRGLYWTGERDRLLRNDEHPIMTTNEVMQPPINAMLNPSVSEAEWLQEYYLPGDRLDDFLKRLGQLLMKNKVSLLNASVRFVKQHQGALSYCDDGNKFAVVLCFNQSLRESKIIESKKWLREAQQMAIQHGGTYYLPYQHVSSPDDFKKAYPRAEAFDAIKKEVDPDTRFISGFYQKYLAKPENTPNHFKTTMSNEEWKTHFKGFLDHVLQRIDSEALYKLLGDIMQYNDSHEEIYQELCRRLPEVMPNALFDLKHILGSLSAIKKDLGGQAYELLKQQGVTHIDGLVEIGYPGRFVGGFKEKFTVTGTVAAVYEAPSVTDYIQTGYPRPYDTFVKLDYSEPTLKSLKDNSAQVITCYVGLHHFPTQPVDQLSLFLKEVRRVLKPGGHFLLVDHDINSDETRSMAHMAHMIFNAVNQTPVQEEMAEIRNFHPMSYWLEQLKNNGLCMDSNNDLANNTTLYIRQEDPSRNRMICVTKNLGNMIYLTNPTQEGVDTLWRDNIGTPGSFNNQDSFFNTKSETNVQQATVQRQGCVPLENSTSFRA